MQKIVRPNRRELIATGAACISTAFLGGPVLANSEPKLHVPPEEAPHEFTLMQWPVSRKVHRDRRFLDLLQNTIANIANTISEFEPVVLLAASEFHTNAKAQLTNRVELWDIPTEDLWCRDSGPLFAENENGETVVSHIQFNGWGRKQIHKNDAQIAEKVAAYLGVPVVSSGLVGEAGGVEHDGHGLLMAHESSWLNDNRNPKMSRKQIEELLLKAYGAQKMIWAPGVWDEDITDYHIDSLARFTGPGRVLMNLTDNLDERDPFHLAALETHEILENANLEVDVISEPRRRRVKSRNFVASYANYYACNGGIIAAQFGDRETDQEAVTALKKHYPDREVITLNVDVLGEIGGGIHCATQQVPKV